MKPERRSVFIGGIAILAAIFDVFEVDEMIYSDSALREGILWQMLGMTSTQDIRQRTMTSLQGRFHVDVEQAERVKKTAGQLYEQLVENKQIAPDVGIWLGWAADIHEVGLSLNHSDFHKHGSYLLQNTDLLGFTRQEQSRLSKLVRLHRRKLKSDIWSRLEVADDQLGQTLIKLLRLAVILNLSRGCHPVPTPELQAAKQNHWRLQFPPNWLATHPLTEQDLQQEAEYHAEVGLTLTVIR